ncbi:hypothetical protein C2S52_006152 [Perilla frutescens var. hirtella]|nr:hypothetical protein C2S52_006152 [Perilla frutescens var. hirtella]
MFDITRPLRRGISVHFDKKVLWLPIKYEGLHIHCYGCGIIGHSYKTCNNYENYDAIDADDLPFGPSLKASPLKRLRNFPVGNNKLSPSLNRSNAPPKTLQFQNEKVDHPMPVGITSDNLLPKSSLTIQASTVPHNIEHLHPQESLKHLPVDSSHLSSQHIVETSSLTKKIKNWKRLAREQQSQDFSMNLVQALKRDIKQKYPMILFLMETKLKEKEIIKIQQMLGFEHMHVVECDIAHGGRRGGLCLFWKDLVSIRILYNSLHHIDGIVKFVDNDDEWRFTGIYGWAEEQFKHLTWELMRSLALSDYGKWLCMGDFNEILYHHEKREGVLREDNKLMAFRDVLNECGLEDLGFSGCCYTWSNGQEGPLNIQERLDRAISNLAWIEAHPNFNVEHLVRIQSDHNPLYLDQRRQAKARPYRFELKQVAVELKKWERSHFGNISRQIEDGKKRLNEIQKMTSCDLSIKEARDLEKEINALMCKEEAMWHQRSRVNWIKDGDKNTEFFHRTTSRRKKRNAITRIKDENDVLITKDDEIENVLVNYFKKLFKSEGITRMDEWLNVIEPRVIDNMKEELERAFTKEEIVEALNQMHPLKSSGPDENIGNNPSYIWRNLVAGKELLGKGISWNVRKGKSVRIWKDWWIPGIKIDDLKNLEEAHPHLSTVDQLISDGRDDCPMWNFSRDGNYTVKSGYWVMKSIKDSLKSKPSSSLHNSDCWMWFWKLNIPPKIKMFVWRCMSGILPTKFNLVKRGVISDPICPRCGLEIETPEHALRDCKWVSFLWETSVLRIQPSLGQDLKASLQDCILCFPFFKCQSMACSILGEYEMINSTPGKILSMNSSLDKWEPPPSGTLKLNSDAAFKDCNNAAIGGAIRDASGKMIKGFAAKLPFCLSSPVAEALACLHGLMMARDLQVTNIVAETNCLELAHYLSNRKVPPAHLGNVIGDILHLITYFKSTRFRWVQRQANLLAHGLAQFATDDFCYFDSMLALSAHLRSFVTNNLHS